MTLRDLMNYAHQMETEYDVNIYDLPLTIEMRDDYSDFYELKSWKIVDGKQIVMDIVEE